MSRDDALGDGPNALPKQRVETPSSPSRALQSHGYEPPCPDDPEVLLTNSPMNNSPMSGGETPGAEALRQTTTYWARRGYRETYHDDYLAQLARRDPLGWRSLPFVGLALLALAGAVAALVVAFRRRPWHVITLVIGPEQRILTHRQRSPHPPAP